MMLKHLCPCCSRHCYLEHPLCERGVEYEKTGEVSPRPFEADGKHGGARAERKERYRTLDQDNKLIWNIRDMAHVIRALAEGKASQSRVLIILSEGEGMTQSELTERLGVQPASVSEVIAKLEGAGLVMRTPSEEDRRTCDIRLTEAGKIKASEAAEQRKQRHTEMFSCLSEEDKADLLTLLEKINHDWRHRYAEKSDECDRRDRRNRRQFKE
ncbi:MAG: MarR family winged helix-turn-helix transcriptional regulator [Christensenellaceae bacterium]